VTEIVVGDARVVLGDCRDVLRTLADNSVDSVVTDPPYEIGFMGRSWDGTGVAYDVTVWAECLRVLKPGGHILAFGGSRTWHRLAVAVEDAGFEIRDSIAWIYGSGFPKSLDVSKAIDKRRDDDTKEIHAVVRWLEQKRKDSGVTRREVEKHFDTENIGQSIFTITSGSTSRVPTWAQWGKLKLLFSFDDSMDAEVWRLNGRKGKPGEAWFEREVIGQGKSGKTAIWNEAGKMGNFDLTAPTTSEAQQWAGWGTALKPAFEPVVVGRKPFGKGVTVAENVLRWGVGGLNIDASRIGTASGLQRPGRSGKGDVGGWSNFEAAPGQYGTPDGAGRWPANVILDEVTAGLVDEQSGVTSPGRFPGNTKKGPMFTGQTYNGGKQYLGHVDVDEAPRATDSGGASRFFYQAKASKRDRNEGLNLCKCDKLKTWENEGQTAQHQADTDQLAPKVIGESGTQNNSDSEWNTSLSGSNTTGNSTKANKSTTSTGTSSTTDSTILLPSIASHTSESTQGVNSEMVSGGSPVNGVASPSPLMSGTGTLAPKGGPNTGDAAPATSELLSNQNKLSAHQCANCLGIIGGHPTVKPTQLMRYLIKLVTPPGGTVLDPFTGSGSTGKAALLDGYKFVGAELTAEYMPIIEGRLRWALEHADVDETLF
jgi:hypothetical protein